MTCTAGSSMSSRLWQCTSLTSTLTALDLTPLRAKDLELQGVLCLKMTCATRERLPVLLCGHLQDLTTKP